MSETPTDRVELTDAEREAIEHAWIISPQDGPAGDDDPMYRAVESIVAARVAALTAERDELEHDLNNEAWANEKAKRDLDAARAELAAANARCAELEAGLAASHAEIAGLHSAWAERDAKTAALQATLDRISALADEWEAEQPIGIDGNRWSSQYVERLRAALTPEGKE